jgi:hypothetical protein
MPLKQVGKKNYAFLPKYSLAPGSTDLPFLIDHGIYAYAMLPSVDVDEFSKILQDSLLHLCQTYSGMHTVALFVITEAYSLSRKRTPLRVNLDLIGASLRQRVQEHLERLSNDFSGDGRFFKRGMLDEFYRLSTISMEYNGPGLV